MAGLDRWGRGEWGRRASLPRCNGCARRTSAHGAGIGACWAWGLGFPVLRTVARGSDVSGRCRSLRSMPSSRPGRRRRCRSGWSRRASRSRASLIRADMMPSKANPCTSLGGRSPTRSSSGRLRIAATGRSRPGLAGMVMVCVSLAMPQQSPLRAQIVRTCRILPTCRGLARSCRRGSGMSTSGWCGCTARCGCRGRVRRSISLPSQLQILLQVVSRRRGRASRRGSSD